MKAPNTPGLTLHNPTLFMRSLLLTAAMALAVAVPAQAQISFSPVVGYTSGDFFLDGPSIGLAFEVGAPLENLPLTPSIRPLIEYVFAESEVTFIRVNGDLIGRFTPGEGSSFAPYAKAGVTLEYVDFSDDFTGGFLDTSDTELSLNIGGGAEFTRFFLEGELGLGGYIEFAVRAGYRF